MVKLGSVMFKAMGMGVPIGVFGKEFKVEEDICAMELVELWFRGVEVAYLIS